MSKHIFWIASYPKSGNTLLRAIICSLFFTEDGKFNFKLLRKIVIFEEMSRLASCLNITSKKINEKKFENKITLIYENLREIQSKNKLGFSEDFAFFKTHFCANFKNYNFLIKEFIRGIIYVYRDPRDICLSWARHTNISKKESINFLLNKNASINWIDIDKYKEYNKNTPVYLSDWQNHVWSWISNKTDCPLFLTSYEEIVYDKKNMIFKLLNFFKKNYNIEINNVDKKIYNILTTTDFNYLQNIENKLGFEEAQKSKFFAVGKRQQWKENLESYEIKKIEYEFENCMKHLNYI